MLAAGGPPTDLVAARAALAAGEWAEALAMVGAQTREPGADALEIRAQAAYGDGDLDGSVAAWEELHALLLSRGDRPGAARAAVMVAMFLMMDTGLMAPVRGWLSRAERLLHGGPEGGTHALVAVVRGYERFMSGDLDGARTSSAAAIALGERHDVQPAVVIGQTCAARVRIFDGDLAGGLALLDEVGSRLMSGEVDALTTGMMYCELICAAQGLGIHDRAAEWTEVMHRWRQGSAFGSMGGRCRVHRAELLRISGPCDAAEEEALAACAELRPWMRREYGWPLMELGTIRLRKGDLAGAEEALLSAHQHGWAPQPALALLRLAQGDLTAATALVDQAVEHPVDVPSKERPPIGELRLAPLLEAQAEIAFAARDAEKVRRAATALTSIATSYGSSWLVAGSALARGRASLLEGDLRAAVEECTRAVTGWVAIGAPYEASSARLVLGRAHELADHPDLARLEWQTAASALSTFGAETLAARARSLLGSARPPAASRRPRATGLFVRAGESRIVELGGRRVTVPDLKGYRYLDRLLGEPGREFHVLDLVAVERGSLPTGAVADREGAGGEGGSGLPVLDDAARASYRRRLAEVDEDIEEATRDHDQGRLELAHRDRDYLIAELSRAFGLGGRERTTGSTAERARTSVSRSLRYALARLSERHPEAGSHLTNALRTGCYCSYSPDLLAAVRWEVGEER